MGRFMALPKMFMSPVPVLRSSVAGLLRTLRTEEDKHVDYWCGFFGFKRLNSIENRGFDADFWVSVLVSSDDFHHFVVNLRGGVLYWDAYVEVHFSFKGNNRVSSAAHHAYKADGDSCEGCLCRFNRGKSARCLDFFPELIGFLKCVIV